MMSKILIVDDEDFIRDMMKDFLEFEGYEFHEAENGKSAFEILNEKKDEISLIFLDYTLPDIKGKEFIKKMRENDIKIPVILTSGLSDNLDVTEDDKEIVKATLSKPFNLDNFLKIVKDIVGK